jgi:hypothetical protein
LRGGRSVTETAEFWLGQGVMKYTHCDWVKQKKFGASPIWYMQVMPDFKTTHTGLANFSSPLISRWKVFNLRVIIPESYMKYSEHNLSAWQTRWKFKGSNKSGTYLKSRSHTCINHKEICHRKLVGLPHSPSVV